MTDYLRRGLSTLADEVVPVDLHDRVARAARVAHRRRQAAAGLAAGLAVVLLAVAVPLALRGRSPDPQIGPTVTASPSASASATVPVAGIRLVFLRASTVPGGGPSALVAYDLGQPAPKTLNDHVDGSASVSVSPDGRKLAMITNEGLFVSAIDGSGRRKLRSNLDGHCGRDWLPDSTELLVTDKTTGLVMRVDAETGAVRQLNFKATDCNQVANSMAISADGKRLAYYQYPQRVVLATIDGAEIRDFGLFGSPRNFSPDGNLVTLASPGGDLAVLDLRTGATTVLATPGEGRIRWAYFTPDGRILAEYAPYQGPFEFVFYAADGHRLARLPWPAALGDATFTGTFLRV